MKRECFSNDELYRHHAGELSEREADDVRQHLAECAACAERASGIVTEHNSWVALIRAVNPSVLEISHAPPARAARLVSDDVPGYEILREVRRGGQGIVYLARQQSTKREVALKVLREGPRASDAARRRFEREIELVAGLSHPNIVTVFDSGETSDGRKYFVMDYICGQRLDHFLAGQSVYLADKLALFSRVCKAINHAHQHGVIHRDLKPSNVLVDEGGEPHVLDFGLARPVAQAEATMMTASGEVAGTLPYMSPEQARGLPDAADVRSDVYALGVMLYELLTGMYPYPVEGDTIQVLKHIAETPPTPPSRIWRRSSRRGGADLRTPGGRKPAKRANEELETIVLKALSKDREQRYQTAGELARDIDHFLAGEPIEAKRDSGWYLLRKALHRHRVAAAVAAAFALVVVAALVVSTTFWRQAAVERDTAWQAQELAEQKSKEAEQQADLARRRFEQVRELANVFIFAIDARIAQLPGSTPARQLIVEKGLTYLDALAQDSAGNLNLQQELAAAYMAIGDVQGDPHASNLGDVSGALESYRKAQQILEKLVAAAPECVPFRQTLLLNHLKIGDAYGGLDDQEAALAAYHKALALGERLLPTHPHDRLIRGCLGNAHKRISGNLQARGDLEGALEHVQKSMRLMEEDAAADPEDLLVVQQLAADHFQVGQIRYEQGRLADALESYHKCLTLSEKFLDAAPEHVYGRHCVAISHQWIGVTLSDMGEHEPALESFRKSVAVSEALLRDDPENEMTQTDLAQTCIAYGETQLALGRREPARSNFERGLALVEALAEPGSERAEVLRLKGVACRQMAELNIAYAQDEASPGAERVQRWQSARAWLQRSLDVFVNMRERGILAPEDAGVRDEIAREIQRCHAALDELTVSANPTSRDTRGTR